MGIGGEYGAINSAIDGLIPARHRGRVDLAVNGTYWLGSVLGTLGTLILLNVLDPSLGWRLGFLIGPVLALFILVLRRHLPGPRAPKRGAGFLNPCSTRRRFSGPVFEWTFAVLRSGQAA